MNYVAQSDEFGCMIASIAMVLDLSYDEVAAVIPLQDADAFRESGKNELGLAAYDSMVALARSMGIAVIDYGPPPFEPKAGVRHIAMIATQHASLNHAVAINEEGIVFNPDPAQRDSREPWSRYSFMALVEFRRL